MSCAECGVNVPKYTCPKCDTKTCSLACCKQHKTARECDGVRPTVPQFVPIRGYSAYSERLSVEDQCFLASVRARATAKKTLKRLKRARPKQPQPTTAPIFHHHDGALGSDGEGGGLSSSTEASGPAALDSFVAAASTTSAHHPQGEGVQRHHGSPVSKIPPLMTMDVSECLSAMIGGGGEEKTVAPRPATTMAARPSPKVSDAHRSVLANARQRRIWLSVEEGKDCGESRYDRFSETIFWTVRLKFVRQIRPDQQKQEEESSANNNKSADLGPDTTTLLHHHDETSSSTKAVARPLVDYADEDEEGNEAEDGEVCDEMRMETNPQTDASSTATKEGVDEGEENDPAAKSEAGGVAAETDSATLSLESALQKENDEANKSKKKEASDEASWVIDEEGQKQPGGTTGLEVERHAYTVHNIPETLTVATLVRQFVRPRAVGGALVSAADLDLAKMRPFIDAAGRDNGLVLYMRVPCGDAERYYVVDPSLPLLDNLRNRYVVGHPTLIVTLGGDFDEFRVLSEEEARQLRDRFRPAMGMAAYTGGGASGNGAQRRAPNHHLEARRQPSQPHMWNLRGNGGGGGGYGNHHHHHHNNYHPYNNNYHHNNNNNNGGGGGYGSYNNNNQTNYRNNNGGGGYRNHANNSGGGRGGRNSFNRRGGNGGSGGGGRGRGGGGRGFNNKNTSRGHVDLDAVLEDPNFGAQSIV